MITPPKYHQQLAYKEFVQKNFYEIYRYSIIIIYDVQRRSKTELPFLFYERKLKTQRIYLVIILKF